MRLNSESQAQVLVKLDELKEVMSRTTMPRVEHHDISSPATGRDEITSRCQDAPTPVVDQTANISQPSCMMGTGMAHVPEAQPAPAFEGQAFPQCNVQSWDSQPPMPPSMNNVSMNSVQANQSPYGVGRSLQKEVTYVIPRECGPELYKFN